MKEIKIKISQHYWVHSVNKISDITEEHKRNYPYILFTSERNIKRHLNKKHRILILNMQNSSLTWNILTEGLIFVRLLG
jgi:hypothetical protein